MSLKATLITMAVFLSGIQSVQAQFYSIDDRHDTTDPKKQKKMDLGQDTLSAMQDTLVAVKTDGRHYTRVQENSSLESGFIAAPLKRIKVNSKFGSRIHPITGKHKFHSGIDLKAHYETVYSMLPGIVERVGEDPVSGKYVVIKTANFSISYCHLSHIAVKKGWQVKAGFVLAISGNTGRSTGPHLHLTLRHQGKSIDPAIIFDFLEKRPKLRQCS